MKRSKSLVLLLILSLLAICLISCGGGEDGGDVEITDVNQNLRIAIGNPIWNNA